MARFIGSVLWRSPRRDHIGVRSAWRAWFTHRPPIAVDFGADRCRPEPRHPPRPPSPPAGADPHALIYRLPIIHVEGESRGTDTDETSARVVAGTVRMIGDGAVRWSMTSSEAAGADAEWVTESVQCGDIGSAIGIIGLWTGAEHSSTDPLGPCWAWKVA